MKIADDVAFYTNETGYPEDVIGRRVINLDDISEQDYAFLRQEMAPIFQTSYNNLTEEDITSISTVLAKVAYEATRQGVDIFKSLDQTVMPLEAQNEYDNVAGTLGHLIDTEANAKAMQEFLYSED